MDHVWRPALEFPAHYEVSDLGYVRSRKTKRILKGIPRKGGYLAVCLSVNGRPHWRLVHVMVLEAHVGPRPLGHEALHGPLGASCNIVSNLRWGTHAENVMESAHHNRSKIKCGRGHPLVGDNVYIRPDKRGRECKACRRDAARSYSIRTKEAV